MSGRAAWPVIEVAGGGIEDAELEAVLRPVDHELRAVTPFGRDLERRAGAELRARLESVGGLPLGGAVITPVRGLPVSFLIHAVVRSAEEPVSEASVRRALLNGIRRAVEWEIDSLGLPLFGTGLGTLEPERAARITGEVLREAVAPEGPPARFVLIPADAYEREIALRLGDHAAPRDTDGER